MEPPLPNAHRAGAGASSSVVGAPDVFELPIPSISVLPTRSLWEPRAPAGAPVPSGSESKDGPLPGYCFLKNLLFTINPPIILGSGTRQKTRGTLAALVHSVCPVRYTNKCMAAGLASHATSPGTTCSSHVALGSAGSSCCSSKNSCERRAGSL